MPRRYPAEVRHQVIELARSGTKVAQLAAAAGQSLQEYLLAELKQQAQEETLDEIIDRAGGRAGGSVGLAFAAETQRADRKRAA